MEGGGHHDDMSIPPQQSLYQSNNQQHHPSSPLEMMGGPGSVYGGGGPPPHMYHPYSASAGPGGSGSGPAASYGNSWGHMNWQSPGGLNNPGVPGVECTAVDIVISTGLEHSRTREANLEYQRLLLANTVLFNNLPSHYQGVHAQHMYHFLTHVRGRRFLQCIAPNVYIPFVNGPFQIAQEITGDPCKMAFSSRNPAWLLDGFKSSFHTTLDPRNGTGAQHTWIHRPIPTSNTWVQVNSLERVREILKEEGPVHLLILPAGIEMKLANAAATATTTTTTTVVVGNEMAKSVRTGEEHHREEEEEEHNNIHASSNDEMIQQQEETSIHAVAPPEGEQEHGTDDDEEEEDTIIRAAEQAVEDAGVLGGEDDEDDNEPHPLHPSPPQTERSLPLGDEDEDDNDDEDDDDDDDYGESSCRQSKRIRPC